VQNAKALLDILWANPVVAYCSVAAVFLVLVSLSGGILKRDFCALAQPKVVIHVILLVTLATLISFLGTYAGELSNYLNDPLQLLSVLGALHRFPLYVLALAYGPTTGLLAVTLFAAFETNTGMHSLGILVFGLELIILGWLALYPSPHLTRWAGSFNATLAYLLAWSTGGIALVAANEDKISVAKIFALHESTIVATAVCIIALWLVGPSFYQKFFPDSRIVPPKTRELRNASSIVK
jgi:hypothetical protein|tara:strand:+ start:5008 stop:5721 length:714 start_codon:yes stop_codon:yes gene_type:complete